MAKTNTNQRIDKLPTGIPGFDRVSQGGLPRTRTTLIAGTAGSAKTVFAVQFLAQGIQEGQNGVFVTFEESPDDIRKNMAGLNWDIAQWEAESKWAFVDASPQPEENVISGPYDLGALLARIESAVNRVGAQRVSLDSLGAIFSQFTEAGIVRRELFRIAIALKRMGVTSLMTTEFIEGGARKNERCLLFAFEESRDQLFRNARGWGVDFEELENNGMLKVVCEYPESSGLEDHRVRMKALIEEFKPNRIAVDSLSPLERVSSLKGYREFVIGLTSFIKHHEVVGLFTATTPTLMGGSSVAEAHISTITDSIILLRYVEMFGEMRRGITILKMRGSRHDKEIREFSIDDTGMHVGKALRGVAGILSGFPQHVPAAELERMSNLFRSDSQSSP